MKTLLIYAHPDFKNLTTYSNAIKEKFKAKYESSTLNKGDLEIMNLYDMQIPRIMNGELFSVWNNQIGSDDTVNSIAQINKALLESFKQSHRIVIISPLHNFNVPSVVKDYLDNILIARETFKYTESGSVGLMTDNRKIWYLQSSGSIYTKKDRYSSLDFSTQYLEAMFVNIMGFDSMYITRAEGTATKEKEVLMEEISKSIETNFGLFYDLL